ncbi:serine hydrolase [Rhizobium sullae]|uniref:Beta-lactamase family protein n=1 Tax=Rhizobium sullae TaxID=50338 RepID=A0A2N0D9J6_RHISU|nr:serine hydrolase [Rhizobium sullae]PKA42742.1 hypothetical protein CWR43_15050 [Rhizobium sullae]TCU14021.1 beta-lactamase family protein [Rhizobium sullae]UWU18136.1 class A beta-lactamase-related serine hydrolase [Rhizobium sullae]
MLTSGLLQQIENELLAFASDPGRSASFAFLHDDQLVSVRGEEPRIAASVIKIAGIGALLCDETLDLDESVNRTDIGSSFLPSITNCFDESSTLTIRMLVVLAISASDNSAAD